MIGLRTRMETEGPSIMMNALGSQEWLILPRVGSSIIPRGSSVGVSKVREFVSTFEGQKNRKSRSVRIPLRT
jgi:hypothetical protein